MLNKIQCIADIKISPLSLSSTCYIKPYILQPQYSDQITFYKTNYQHIVTYCHYHHIFNFNSLQSIIQTTPLRHINDTSKKKKKNTQNLCKTQIYRLFYKINHFNFLQSTLHRSPQSPHQSSHQQSHQMNLPEEKPPSNCSRSHENRDFMWRFSWWTVMGDKVDFKSSFFY